MRTGVNNDQSKRPILVDFELYTDGDPEFKKELITLMIDNLSELKLAGRQSLEVQNTEVFSKACHKIKITLVMLADQELQAATEALTNQGMNPDKISDLNKIIEELIAGLLDVDK